MLQSGFHKDIHFTFSVRKLECVSYNFKEAGRFNAIPECSRQTGSLQQYNTRYSSAMVMCNNNKHLTLL